MSWMCQFLFIIVFSISSGAEVNNKNPFEPLIFNQKVLTANEFVTLILTKQESFLNSLPEYNKKLKGIQSYKLNNEFRRAQFFYHNAVLNFVNKNISHFIGLNPTPEQVHAVLKRTIVDTPVGLFAEHPLLFSKALNVQRKLLNHFIPKAGKLEAINTLLNYKPFYIELHDNKIHIVENHIAHLAKIGLLDNLEMLENFDKKRPYFFDTISYLKHFFHYAYLSPEQKTKKLISILLNTYDDVQIDFLKYKKELINSGVKVSLDYLDESNSLQYANAKMQAVFLESQLILILKNYLESHFLKISLNQYDAERLLNIASAFGYNLEVYNNKLIGLSEKPSLLQTFKNMFSPKPAINRSKMCFLIFI